MGPVNRPSVAYGVDDHAGRFVVVRATQTRRGASCAVIIDQEQTPDQARTHPALNALTVDVTSGRAVTAAALPAGSGLSRWLETPFASRGKAIRVLPSLLDLQLPFPVEQCHYRFPIVRRSPDGRIHALAVAARADDLDHRLQELAAAGQDPMIIDPEGLALWDESRRVAAPPRIVAWIGMDRFTLVVGDGDGFLSAHGFRVGAWHLTDDGALRRWAARVQHVLRSQVGTATDRPTWLWTGPGAADSDLRQRLEQVLADPMTYALAPEPATFLATALARRALTGESGTCNLRTEGRSHPQVALRERNTVLRTCGVGLAAGLLIAALGTGGRAAFELRDRTVQGQVTKLAMDLTGLPAIAIARGNEVFVTRHQMSEDPSATDPFSRALRPGPSQALGHGIRAAHQANIRVFSWAARDRTFTIRGMGPAWSACEDYARLLREQGLVVELQHGAEDDGGAAAFVLKGSWSNG